MNKNNDSFELLNIKLYRKAINFDLSTNQLKKLYHTNNPFVYLKAYREIGSFLKQEGFIHRQWSGYISKEKLSDVDIFNITYRLNKALPWLCKCVRKFDVTDIGEQHDLMYIFQKSDKIKLQEKISEQEVHTEKAKAVISRNTIKNSAKLIASKSKSTPKIWESKGINCRREMPFFKGERTSMWSLIPQKKMPPTRLMRYCCSILKETAGKNSVCVSGIRWAESNNRKKRGLKEVISSNVSNQVILNNDNDDKRRLVERCQMQSKIMCNVIADWSDEDVKQYIEAEHLQLNPLYRFGFKRVGCIGCPMAGKKRYEEFARYPKFMNLYIRAFDEMLKAREADGKTTKWFTAMDVFHWWMEDGVANGQISLFDD